MSELLEIDHVDIRYETRDSDLRAVNDASLSIGANEYMGLVGESGSGKSTLAKAIIGGLDDNGRVDSGAIRFEGTEIQDYDDEQYAEEIRWKEISLVPQAAMNSLDPTLKVKTQALGIANRHTDWAKERTVERLSDLFEVVGLPPARIDDYPHQFSGGMKQRAVIALSLLLEPSLIIADEPTTASDVIMQDQILKYLDEIREVQDVSLLMITHDISVVFELCDTVTVMHGGQVAETGSLVDCYDRPRHPYTILLKRAFPDLRYPDRTLEVIDGAPPKLRDDVDYCTFVDRCPWATEDCRDGAPPLEAVDGDETHRASCIRSEEVPRLVAERFGEDSVEVSQYE